MHRRMLAEVTPEADGAHTVVRGVEALELGEAAVGRPVVHEDDLEGLAEPLQRGDRAPVQLVDRRRLVVERDDDRDHRSITSSRPRSSSIRRASRTVESDG